ncbi:oligosaccharide flippase family protein [Aquimarina sp. SS2-1]|uniref:oligosaccharide flippase family protein n=1 Tax=Aquimarina besae TaxID=3342247 RepID=UPI00366C33DA
MKNKIRLDKSLFESLFSLGLAQFFNYLSPLISFPLLLSEFGVEKYGIISTAFVLALLFCSLADFGFNISGVKFIAQNKEKKDVIFSSIFFLKSVLTIILLLVFYFIIDYNESYRDYKIIFVYSSGMILARILNVDWFFQGKEKMRFIAITNLIANTIYVVGIIIIIKINLDFKYVTLFKSSGVITAGLVSMLCAVFFFNIKFEFKLKEISYYLKEGSSVFISTIASNIFQNTPVLIVKMLFPYEIVGVYSSIEKLVSFGKQMVMIINQVFHPRLAIYFVMNFNKFIQLWKKSSLLSLFAGISVVIFLFLLKDLIFGYFSELKEFDFANPLYFLMSFLIITYTILNALGLNGLLVINKTRNLALSQVYPLVLYITISIVLIVIKIENVLLIVFTLLMVDLLIISIRIFMFKSGIKEHHRRETLNQK